MSDPRVSDAPMHFLFAVYVVTSMFATASGEHDAEDAR
eukprot:CAMPEP_0170646242 /NCGR_PEP_ID=MMETSP0224-20130122/43529_1 /TAXON_ID=285029 /ORGANISM="Togula jolla, Strain CCCM 725" /LENGTH=37 /DNA_ID= /DNA_START= /DNA_END= /DNA_ORIENTATION=